MISTLVTLLVFIPTSSTEIVYVDVPENIEFCESVYFYNLEQFNKNGCNLALVEKRISDIKNRNN